MPSTLEFYIIGTNGKKLKTKQKNLKNTIKTFFSEIGFLKTPNLAPVSDNLHQLLLLVQFFQNNDMHIVFLRKKYINY